MKLCGIIRSERAKSELGNGRGRPYYVTTEISFPLVKSCCHVLLSEPSGAFSVVNPGNL
jgi:hypothetical protein